MLTRKSYLMDIDEMELFPDSDRRAVSSSNMAYAAAAADSDRADVLAGRPQIKANIGIINSYSDMLSAHRPFSDLSKYNKNCSKKR
jgi:dihydroxyacid dehydratase/phosphogluconate dehydratase